MCGWVCAAGKSTLLYKKSCWILWRPVDWEQIIYINFEDERLSEFTVADFKRHSVGAERDERQKGYFFLDEVQNIDGWEKFARRMADAKEHIYITGSNAKMLSRERNHAGRTLFARHITPYAFGEYLTACGIPHDEPALLGTKQTGRSRRLRAVSAIRRPAGIALLYKGKTGVYFRRIPEGASWAASSRGTASATIMR